MKKIESELTFNSCNDDNDDGADEEYSYGEEPTNDVIKNRTDV